MNIENDLNKTKVKYCEICCNARDNGMIDDPKVTFDSIVDSDCGFELRKELISLGEHEESTFPRVCGNCIWYTVQY